LAAPSIVEDEIFHPHIPVSDTQEITVDIEFKTLKFILRYIYTGVLDKELLLSTGMLKWRAQPCISKKGGVGL